MSNSQTQQQDINSPQAKYIYVLEGEPLPLGKIEFIERVQFEYLEKNAQPTAFDWFPFVSKEWKMKQKNAFVYRVLEEPIKHTQIPVVQLIEKDTPPIQQTATQHISDQHPSEFQGKENTKASITQIEDVNPGANDTINQKIPEIQQEQSIIEESKTNLVSAAEQPKNQEIKEEQEILYYPKPITIALNSIETQNQVQFENQNSNHIIDEKLQQSEQSIDSRNIDNKQILPPQQPEIILPLEAVQKQEKNLADEIQNQSKPENVQISQSQSTILPTKFETITEQELQNHKQSEVNQNEIHKKSDQEEQKHTVQEQAYKFLQTAEGLFGGATKFFQDVATKTKNQFQKIENNEQKTISSPDIPQKTNQVTVIQTIQPDVASIVSQNLVQDIDNNQVCQKIEVLESRTQNEPNQPPESRYFLYSSKFWPFKKFKYLLDSEILSKDYTYDKIFQIETLDHAVNGPIRFTSHSKGSLILLKSSETPEKQIRIQQHDRNRFIFLTKLGSTYFQTTFWRGGRTKFLLDFGQVKNISQLNFSSEKTQEYFNNIGLFLAAKIPKENIVEKSMLEIGLTHQHPQCNNAIRFGVGRTQRYIDYKVLFNQSNFNGGIFTRINYQNKVVFNLNTYLQYNLNPLKVIISTVDSNYKGSIIFEKNNYQICGSTYRNSSIFGYAVGGSYRFNDKIKFKAKVDNTLNFHNAFRIKLNKIFDVVLTSRPNTVIYYQIPMKKDVFISERDILPFPFGLKFDINMTD